MCWRRLKSAGAGSRAASNRFRLEFASRVRKSGLRFQRLVDRLQGLVQIIVDG